MKKKLMIILVTAFLTGITGVNAQVVNNNTTTENIEDVEDEDEDEEEGDDEEDIEVLSEDEFAVTDQEGNEEVIEFPEAMTYDLDSLLNLYMSKTYLGTPGDCEMKNENPTYPREVYIERLSRIPSVMELAYNVFPMIAFAGKGFLRAGPRKKPLPWGFGAAREEEAVGPAITPDPEVKESEESSAPPASDAGRRAHAQDNDFTLETAPADKSAGFSGYGFRAAPSLIEETDEKGQSPER